MELYLCTEKSQYEIDDIILSEYGTTVVGLEMMRSVNEENAEEDQKGSDCKISDQHTFVFRTGSNHSYF